jgi:hypothetical protein
LTQRAISDTIHYISREAVVAHKTPQVMVAVMMGLLLASTANAQPVSSAAKKKAPAPFLAAGIPAFVALGGGALIGRIKRRRKPDDQDASSGEIL